MRAEQGEEIYTSLAQHLDRAHAGAPMSPYLLQILKILYPGEEAEVALNLEIYSNKTLDEVSKSIPDKAERLEEILSRMAKRGTVLTVKKHGEERIYRLLPSIVGFAEVPFLKGEDTPEKKELSRLWRAYLEDRFGEELARGVPLIRVIPIAESLEDTSQILPFDDIAEKLEGVSYLAVGHCPCRQMARNTGEGCDHPTERCLHFGTLAEYLVEQGIARQITKEEALGILHKATEEGLVHVCDNLEGHIRTICNCCPCCCAFFRARTDFGFNTLSKSNYVASVDKDACITCGTCEERCPVNAISLEGDFAEVDEEVCIGCGVCTPTCEGDGAIRLHKREQVIPPPDLQNFVAARLRM